jgi:hypothetical protein
MKMILLLIATILSLTLPAFDQYTVPTFSAGPLGGGSDATQPCSGSPCLDDFNEGDGVPLSVSWTTNSGHFNSYDPAVYGIPDISDFSLAWYNAGTFTANQASCLTLYSATAGENVGIAVRLASSGTTGYFYLTDGTSAGYIQKAVSGTVTNLGSSFGPITIGHEFCLSAVGTTITLKDITSSTTLRTVTDSSISSGSAGIGAYNTVTGETSGSAWLGYNCSYTGVC